MILNQSNVPLKGDCKRRNCVYSQQAIIVVLWPTIQSISNQRTMLTSRSFQFKLNQVSDVNHSKIVIKRKKKHTNWFQVLTISSMLLEDLGLDAYGASKNLLHHQFTSFLSYCIL